MATYKNYGEGQLLLLLHCAKEKWLGCLPPRLSWFYMYRTSIQYSCSATCTSKVENITLFCTCEAVSNGVRETDRVKTRSNDHGRMVRTEDLPCRLQRPWTKTDRRRASALVPTCPYPLLIATAFRQVESEDLLVHRWGIPSNSLWPWQGRNVPAPLITNWSASPAAYHFELERGRTDHLRRLRSMTAARISERSAWDDAMPWQGSMATSSSSYKNGQRVSGSGERLSSSSSSIIDLFNFMSRSSWCSKD